MTEGIRIKHTVLKAPVGQPNMIVAVRDVTERITGPYPACSICSAPGWQRDPALEVNHEGYKTRHIEIDSEGFALVSAGVLEGLSHLVDHGGFEIMNVISNPPTQNLVFGANGTIKRTVIQKVPREIVMKG